MTAFDPQVYATPLDAAGKALVARHAAWWQRKEALVQIGPGAPLGDLWLPLADGSLASHDIDLTPEMLDYERLAGEPRDPGPLERVGDLFAERAPYTRVPWVEAILGCPIRATIHGGSMRTHSFIRDWDEWKNRPVRRHEGWFDALKHLTEILTARSGGRYATAHTLMRGPCDLAEAVLGPELMCLSMYDHPKELTAFLEEATATFIEILLAQHVSLVPVEPEAVAVAALVDAEGQRASHRVAQRDVAAAGPRLARAGSPAGMGDAAAVGAPDVAGCSSQAQ